MRWPAFWRRALSSFARIEKLRREVSTIGLDALIVTDLVNVRYLSGFTGSSGVLFVGLDEVRILTDGRYASQVAEECPGIIANIGTDWIAGAKEAMRGMKRVGFEDHSLSWRQWKELSDALSDVKLLPVKNPVARQRLVKDQAEIAALKEAIRITSETCAYIRERISPGMTEKEVALLIDYRMRESGADKEAFDTIVAAGPRSALP
ncbi:MAG: M24 family metallopeptidase, partial [Armatimonadota bacterium]